MQSFRLSAIAASLLLLVSTTALAQDAGLEAENSTAATDGGVGDAGAHSEDGNDETAEHRPSKLLIATKQAPPFSLKNADGEWTGLSIELWRRIADELDYSAV